VSQQISFLYSDSLHTLPSTSGVTDIIAVLIHLASLAKCWPMEVHTQGLLCNPKGTNQGELDQVNEMAK
jgi:hypothetical protein